MRPLPEEVPSLGNLDNPRQIARVLQALLAASREETDDEDAAALAAFFAYVLSHPGVFRGQLFQDAWVAWMLGDKRGGYFVEFGAADGYGISNSYALETRFGWRGVIAEPNPVFHESLRRRRACTLSTKCVYRESGLSLPFAPAENAELSRLRDIVPDDVQEREQRRVLRPEDEIAVETVSLDDLLEEAGAPREIDFISVDTEGSELEILSAFDFDRWSVSLMCVEHNHTPQQKAIDALLESKGFTRVWRSFTLFDAWYMQGREVR